MKLSKASYKRFPFPELQGKLTFLQKHSIHSSHEPNTSEPTHPFHFINADFRIIFKSVWGSIISKITWIYAGSSGIQMLVGAMELSLLWNIQTSSSAYPASNYSFISGSIVARADSLIIHIHLEQTLYLNSTYLPPWHTVAQLYFTLTTYLCTYLSTAHILSGFIKERFYSSYCLRAHYVTHLFHPYWSNYFYIMKSFNNKYRYIIFCVLMLLTNF